VKFKLPPEPFQQLVFLKFHFPAPGAVMIVVARQVQGAMNDVRISSLCKVVRNRCA
jgi:hypothetical protein